MRWRVVLIVLALVGLFMTHGAFAGEPAGPVQNGRPVMVFTTFPSAGFSEVFRRILEEAYGSLGYNARVERMPAARALEFSDGGKVDGEAGRLSVIEKDYKNLVRVPTPIYHTKLYVWSRDVTLDVSRGWESVRKYRLGTLTGYKYVESMTTDMDRVLVPSYEKLMQMLESGRLDIVVLSLFDGLPVLNAMRLNDIHQIEPPLGVFPMYHYLNQKHADLVPKVDQVLQAMERTGRLKEIVDQAVQELGQK